MDPDDQPKTDGTQVVNSATELNNVIQQSADIRGLACVVRGSGNFYTDTVLVGEYPGDREVSLGKPFVGGSGKYFFDVLRRQSVTYSNVWATNVVKRPVSSEEDDTDSKTKISQGELEQWASLLRYELSHLPNIKYIVVLGGYALHALTGETGITKWRGSVLSKTINGREYTIICCNNPAAVMRSANLDVVFRMDVDKLRRVKEGKWYEHSIDYEINPSSRQALDYISRMHDENSPIAYDIETIGRETACIGLANDTHSGMCIAFRNRQGSVYSTVEERTIRKHIQQLFTRPGVRLVAQNASFDAGWLGYKDRIGPIRTWFDTLLAHHTLYPHLPHNLGFLTSQYTTHPYYKDDLDAFHEGGDIDEFWKYNIKDVCITLKCQQVMLDELRNQKLEQFFFNHVMRLQPHLIGMTTHGVLIDQGVKATLEHVFSQEMEQTRQQFVDRVRSETNDPEYDPNPGSWQQLQELFFRRLKLVGRGASTNEENRNRMRSHPRTSDGAKEILTLVDQYKEKQKFYGTYATFENDPDDRFRCEYKQYGVSSTPGRLSSSETHWETGMNGQNQPEKAKPMFIADPGKRLIYFDLAQAEARVVAYLWGVQGLIDNFELQRTEGIDVHRANAARIFRLPYDEIPTEDWDENKQPTKRYLGKRCVHGLNYRMGPDKLAAVCGISIQQATDAWQAYHRAFPEIKKGWEQTLDGVYRTREIWTPMGRRLKFLSRLPDRYASFGSSDAGALDGIIAFVPQSTIGEKVASVQYLSSESPGWDNHTSRVLLNLHDALIAQVPDNDDEAFHHMRIMKKHAEAPIMINGSSVSIPADFAWSVPDEHGLHRWSSLKKIKLKEMNS